MSKSVEDNGLGATALAGGLADGPPAAGDPVLLALKDAEAHYLETRAEWERRRAEAHRAEQAERRLAEEVGRLQGELARERRRLAQAQERARRVADGLKDVHRALFDGDVYGMILRVCMTLTGSTRGLYVNDWGEGRRRVRASAGVGDQPGAAPSEFVAELCSKVLAVEEPITANSPAEIAELPASDRGGDRFRNCLAAPALLLSRFNGVVILADKADGGYDADDAELILSVGDQAAVAVENRRLQDELLEAYFGVVGVLADAVEAKDPYTHGHCETVARYGRLTAERLGLAEGLRSVVCFGGLLHDVGKIGVSDGVLNKMGKLLPEEWDLMRSHVRVGRDLLARVPALATVADVVLHHHERFDGGGYPDGLAGEQISLAARIICVVDSYSAMVSKRSYKDSMSEAEARAELERCKGSHFDPAVVDAFLAVLESPLWEEECPDGFGVPPRFYHPMELRHALEGGTSGRRGGSAAAEPIR